MSEEIELKRRVTDNQEVKQVSSEMSENIGKISLALSKAQGAMSGVEKNKENPFFKSKYADLSALIDEARESLSKNEIAVIQTTGNDEKHVIIKTILSHSSGEWLKGELKVPLVKFDAQALGSAITYGRRYALAAILNIAQADDDGLAANAETGATNRKNKPTSEQAAAFNGFINDKDSLGLFLFSGYVETEIYNSLFSSYKRTFEKNTKTKRLKEFNDFRKEGELTFNNILDSLSEGDALKLFENTEDIPEITEKLLLLRFDEQQKSEYEILKSELGEEDDQDS